MYVILFCGMTTGAERAGVGAGDGSRCRAACAGAVAGGTLDMEKKCQQDDATAAEW